jgi:hypothetical protein
MSAHGFSEEHLAAVWSRLRWKRGRSCAKELAVGVDGMRPEAFDERLTWHLAEIARLIRRPREDGLPAYRFGPLLQFEHAKPGGGVRLIHVPRLRDQVVLRALHEELCSSWREHAGINLTPPEPRATLDAFRRLLRQPGAKWALRADIKSFFDTVPREAAIEMAVTVPLHNLARDLLRIWSGDVRVRPAWRAGKSADHPASGLPQGLSLSASLAELWASRLDGALKGKFSHLRFVDDIVVVGESAAEMEQARDTLIRAAADLGLELSAAKTKVMPLDQGVPWLGMLHFLDRSIPIPDRVDKWLHRFVGIRRRAGRDLDACSEPAERSEVVRRFHAMVREELSGNFSWRVRWYALAEEDGTWRELDRSLHAMIRSLHRRAGEAPPVGRRLPSVHRSLRLRRLSASHNADQGPCAISPPHGGISADQGLKAHGEAESS